MEFKVFWSWQDNLNNAYNKHFIHDCLEKAVKQISKKREPVIIPVVDRDTKNKTGSPNIVSTVFSKIKGCQVFVGDVSIVADIPNIEDGERRSFPNPNVLIELGYAWNSVGEENVLLVVNRAYGEVEDMPFNIKQKRHVLYCLDENSTQSETDRTAKSLTEGFQHEIEEMYKRFIKTASILEFEGTYEIHGLEGEPTRKTIVSVTATGYSSLAIKCENGELSWQGQIQISETNPSSGQGEFTYTKGNNYAFGTHTIRRRRNGDISVFGVADFPHLHEFRVIWKKIDRGIRC